MKACRIEIDFQTLAELLQLPEGATIVLAEHKEHESTHPALNVLACTVHGMGPEHVDGPTQRMRGWINHDLGVIRWLPDREHPRNMPNTRRVPNPMNKADKVAVRLAENNT